MRDRKVRLEVHIGPDDDARWWVIASVDGEEALWHGPYEHQADAGGEPRRSWERLRTLCSSCYLRALALKSSAIRRIDVY